MRLGDNSATMCPFVEIYDYAEFSVADHGLHREDIDPSRNRQRVNPILRLIDPVRNQRVGCCLCSSGCCLLVPTESS